MKKSATTRLAGAALAAALLAGGLATSPVLESSPALATPKTSKTPKAPKPPKGSTVAITWGRGSAANPGSLPAECFAPSFSCGGAFGEGRAYTWHPLGTSIYVHSYILANGTWVTFDQRGQNPDDIFTGWVPISDAAALLLDERWAQVRVSIPRS